MACGSETGRECLRGAHCPYAQGAQTRSRRRSLKRRMPTQLAEPRRRWPGLLVARGPTGAGVGRRPVRRSLRAGRCTGAAGCCSRSWGRCSAVWEPPKLRNGVRVIKTVSGSPIRRSGRTGRHEGHAGCRGAGQRAMRGARCCVPWSGRPTIGRRR